MNDQERLIVDNMGYAKSIAWQTIRKLPRNVAIDHDDIEQLAYQGLIQAAQRFDPSQFDGRGDLNSFFKTYAYNRIRGTIIDETRKLTFVRRRGLEKGITFQFSSIDCHDAKDIPMAELELAQTMDVERAIAILSDREQKVVYGFMVGNTGREIADDLGVTESRVSQIKGEALGKMLQVMA